MLRLSQLRRENFCRGPRWHVRPARDFGLDKSLFMCIIAVLVSVAACRWLNAHFSMRYFNWIGRNTLQIYVIHRIF